MRRKDCALRIQINAQKSLSMVMDLLTSNAFSLRNISKIAMPRRLLYALATVKKRRTNWLSVASENFSCAVNCAAAKASIMRTLGSADEVLEKAWQLATFDANEISQYRRGACRYCWGFGHQYQCVMPLSLKRSAMRHLSGNERASGCRWVRLRPHARS